MQKKRVMHRLQMIAPDKVMIIGGFNNEEGTLDHCEV